MKKMSELEDIPNHGLSRREILDTQDQMNAFIDKHELKMLDYQLGKHQIKNLPIQGYFLFNRWSMTTDLASRWSTVWESSKRLRELLIESKAGKKDIRVLDIGCGHCAYWPILNKFNVTKFTGIDLFDLTTASRVKEVLFGLLATNHVKPALDIILRSKNLDSWGVDKIFDENLRIPESVELSNYIASSIMTCAVAAGALMSFNNLNLTHKMIKNILPDVSARLLMSKAEDFEVILAEDEKFDIIMCMAAATTSGNRANADTGGKNAGVSKELLDKIAEKHLAPGGTVAHVPHF